METVLHENQLVTPSIINDFEAMMWRIFHYLSFDFTLVTAPSSSSTLVDDAMIQIIIICYRWRRNVNTSVDIDYYGEEKLLTLLISVLYSYIDSTSYSLIQLNIGIIITKSLSITIRFWQKFGVVMKWKSKKFSFIMV